MLKTYYRVLILGACLSCYGCGGSSNNAGNPSDDGGNSMPESSFKTGRFIDGSVAGLTYSTETQSGVTSSSGEFSYKTGENITFSIGSLTFPTTQAKEFITPFDLSQTTAVVDDVVVNISRLLQSLDTDGNPSNGITISDLATTVAVPISFDVNKDQFSTSTDIINLVANSGSTNTDLISELQASDHLMNSLSELGLVEPMDKLAYSENKPGKTQTGPDNAGPAFFRPDGVKIGRRVVGEVVVREWYLDNEGLMCETLLTGGALSCVSDIDDFSATQLDNTVNVRLNGQYFSLFYYEGNTFNLVEP